MTTITIKNGHTLSRNKFENIADLQDYLISISVQNEHEISDEHKTILDERIKEAKENSDNFMTFNQFKASITRKNV